MGATGAQVGFRDVFLSEQLTATSTETNALSSGSEFMTSLGLRLGPVVRVARHVSNGGLVGIGLNHGETMSLVGVTFCSAA
ncbi:MAG TPA: hypothetical protein VF292_12475 [Rhodanobacteraceae bacterium]